MGATADQVELYLADLSNDLKVCPPPNKPKNKAEAIAATGVMIAKNFAKGLMVPVSIEGPPSEWRWKSSD